MSRSTIHGIHSILSGAFEAAERWEWGDFNPAESAKAPTVIQKKAATLQRRAVGVEQLTELGVGVRVAAVSQRGDASGVPGS
jgi:hypothetical protein